MTTVVLQGQPDGNFWPTAFDEAVWKESKRLGEILYNYVTIEKDRRLPSANWCASLIQAFTAVAYKNKREYKKADFLTWWRPRIIEENSMLDNVLKSMYPYKFDRGIGGLRELREKGLVPDLIWLPWKQADKYEHDVISPFTNMQALIKKLPFYVGIGVAVYVGVPALIKALSKK